jgi:hypothetical protein
LPRLDQPVSRGFIVDGEQPHATPVIVEIANGAQWSVDSWTKAYGQGPDIMTIREWKAGIEFGGDDRAAACTRATPICHRRDAVRYSNGNATRENPACGFASVGCGVMH